MHRWEAVLLAALFGTQLFFFDTTVRLGYASFYMLLALLLFVRDVPAMPGLWRAARDTALQRQTAPGPSDRAPP
jgi:hypothetical protein